MSRLIYYSLFALASLIQAAPSFEMEMTVNGVKGLWLFEYADRSKIISIFQPLWAMLALVFGAFVAITVSNLLFKRTKWVTTAGCVLFVASNLTLLIDLASGREWIPIASAFFIVGNLIDAFLDKQARGFCIGFALFHALIAGLGFFPTHPIAYFLVSILLVNVSISTTVFGGILLFCPNFRCGCFRGRWMVPMGLTLLTSLIVVILAVWLIPLVRFTNISELNRLQHAQQQGGLRGAVPRLQGEREARDSAGWERDTPGHPQEHVWGRGTPLGR
jgi:hypothetical protein